ncbi:MAG TPA: winged helix-turn-helix domain-containing protein [Solirubrobacterales bacterium]|nr:winged helix-turn-helix domain-containing protein [Solirubrobacterales bacterium]
MAEAVRRRAPLGADPRVLKVLGHPVRYRIFSKLGDRPWSSVQLQAELGIPYESVREHLRVLTKEGLAEPAGYESSPLGGRRTLYRAERFYFTAEQWAELPEEIRRSGSSTIVELLTRDSVDALQSGEMDSRDDRVLLRRPLWTDDEGAKEIEEIMVRADREVAEVDQRSLERRNRSTAKPVRLMTALLSFPASERSGGNSP